MSKHKHMHTCIHNPHTQTQGQPGGVGERKEKALINCCSTLLDGAGPTHKSGFYGPCSVPNLLAFSPLVSSTCSSSRNPSDLPPGGNSVPSEFVRVTLRSSESHVTCTQSNLPLTHCAPCKNCHSAAVYTCVCVYIRCCTISKRDVLIVYFNANWLRLRVAFMSRGHKKTDLYCWYWMTE